MDTLYTKDILKDNTNNNNKNHFEKLQLDKSAFSYLVENVNVSEKALEEITPRLFSSFENQLNIDEVIHEEYKTFKKHFLSFCWKQIPNLTKEQKQPKNTILSPSKPVKNGSKYISNFDD